MVRLAVVDAVAVVVVGDAILCRLLGPSSSKLVFETVVNHKVNATLSLIYTCFAIRFCAIDQSLYQFSSSTGCVPNASLATISSGVAMAVATLWQASRNRCFSAALGSSIAAVCS